MEALTDRTIGRLKHLRQGPKNRPVQVTFKRDQILLLDQHVFGIGTIDGPAPAHAAHHRDYLLTRLKGRVGINLIDDANALDAEDPGKLEVG